MLDIHVCVRIRVFRSHAARLPSLSTLHSLLRGVQDGGGGGGSASERLTHIASHVCYHPLSSPHRDERGARWPRPPPRRSSVQAPLPTKLSRSSSQLGARTAFLADGASPVSSIPRCDCPGTPSPLVRVPGHQARVSGHQARVPGHQARVPSRYAPAPSREVRGPSP